MQIILAIKVAATLSKSVAAVILFFRKLRVAFLTILWYVVLLQGGEAHEQTAGNTLPQPIHSAGAGRTSKGNQLLPPPADGAAGKVRTQIAAENGG